MQTTINGHIYDTGKLNAKKQFHVVRRLAPLLSNAAGVLQTLKQLSAQDSLDAITDEEGLQVLGESGGALAALPEQDVDYIIDACLSVTRRQAQGGTGWCPLTTTGGDLMFNDMSMSEMMQLVFAVLKESLGDFFDALPQTSPDAAAQTPPPADG